MEAAISHRGRLTILFVATLVWEHTNAQSGDELLREFSAAERASIKDACYTASLLGPAQFYTCVARKADELRKSPGEPTLGEFSREEQSSIRSACYTAGLLGPAAFYACLQKKATELLQSPGEPSLTEFSTSEQASIRNACYTAGLLGPASFYACLAQKGDELRAVRRRLGLGAPISAPEMPNPPAPPTSTVIVAAPPAAEAPVQAPALPQVHPARGVATPPMTLSSLQNQRISEQVSSSTARPVASALRPATVTPQDRIQNIVPAPPASAASVPARQPVRPRRSPAANPAQREDDFTFGVLCVIAAAIAWIVRYLHDSRSAPLPGGDPETGAPQQTSDAYRPRRTHARQRGITFADPRTDTLWSPHETDLTDVRDAITGQPLRPALGLHRCMRCHVFYETASVECIQRENGGRCISCGTASVSPINGASPGEQSSSGDHDEITTLDNYRERVGQLVVFEGHCVRVLPSRSGTAYAVMFEHGTWTEGFKLVVRTGFVAHVGGADFIRRLAGSTVRARGVIAHSPVFGYEITITTRSMILEVR